MIIRFKTIFYYFQVGICIFTEYFTSSFFYMCVKKNNRLASFTVIYMFHAQYKIRICTTYYKLVEF